MESDILIMESGLSSRVAIRCIDGLDPHRGFINWLDLVGFGQDHGRSSSVGR